MTDRQRLSGTSRVKKLKRRNRRLRRLNYEAEMREILQVSAIPEAEEPGVDGLPLDTSYSDRGPFDVVISGPVGKKIDKSKAPGRWFATPWDALTWAEEKYGRDRVKLLNLEESARWAILVKNLRK